MQDLVSDPELTFPENFIWGTATAAYQIEGATREGGRGESIWDKFSHIPGNIQNGDNGDVACDHYHKWEEDLDLIASLVSHYRFSISWTRILPDGTGAENPEGIEFYNKLIDGLIARGVTPWVTMFHWDLPQALQDKGGWGNREILNWFSAYAATLRKHFGDRVKNWIILNEPSVHGWIGHGLGFHAPGLAIEDSYLSAVHHQNMVVGKIYREMKDANSSYNVGSSYTLLPIRGEAEDTPEEIVARMDGFWNRNHFDPLMLGRYPAVFEDDFAALIRPGDMEVCQTKLDFVGVQHYNAIEAKEDKSRIFDTFFGAKPEGKPTTDYGWTIEPKDFYLCLMDFTRRYGTEVSIIITENGAAFFDAREGDASHDPRRISFLNGYIRAVFDAMQDGANIQGYFVWSFMDNFEWADGYKYRFGLVFIDYENQQERVPKDSYYWYQALVAKQTGRTLEKSAGDTDKKTANSGGS